MSWFPDGSRIVFSMYFGAGDCPPGIPTTGAHLFTIRPNGTDLEELTHGWVNAFGPAWSPTVAGSSSNETPDVVRIKTHT